MAGRISLNVSLTPELADYVRQQVRTGRYGSVSEVIRAAIRQFAAVDVPASPTAIKDQTH